MDELLAENEAYDDAIRVINSKRAKGGTLKLMANVEQGRRELEDLMRRPSQPFASIADPTHEPKPGHSFKAKTKSVSGGPNDAV